MHRTKETASKKTGSRTQRPLLAPDVDVRVLEFCGPPELGRCAAVSTGLRAAADLAWKPVATTRFPLLASIARAGIYKHSLRANARLPASRSLTRLHVVRSRRRPRSDEKAR